MTFEFDSSKSQRNREKHGIDFAEAQVMGIQQSPQIITKTLEEPLFLVVGKINNKYWSAVITYRVENIRIISVRRSRDEEIEIYESF